MDRSRDAQWCHGKAMPLPRLLSGFALHHGATKWAFLQRRESAYQAGLPRNVSMALQPSRSPAWQTESKFETVGMRSARMRRCFVTVEIMAITARKYLRLLARRPSWAAEPARSGRGMIGTEYAWLGEIIAQVPVYATSC